MMKRHNLLALLMVFVSAMAAAAQEGDLVLSAGAVKLDNSNSSSSPQQNELGSSIATKTGMVPQSFSSPGTQQTVGDAIKPILTLSYYMTDHWSVTGVIGIPPKLEIYGQGSVSTPGLLNKLVPAVPMGSPADNPVASVLHWFPAVLLKYNFNAAHDTIRPFVGVGVGYSFFTHVRLHQQFEQDLKKTGGFLAFASTLDTANTAQADATASFRPLINAGVQWNLDKTWSLNFGMSYVAVKTNAIITVKDKTGQTVLTSTAKLDIPTADTSFTVGHVF